MCAAGAQVLFGCCLFFCGCWGTAAAGRRCPCIFFFFNGGLGILYFLGGEPGKLRQAVYCFYETPTNLVGGKEIRWVNVVVGHVLPQRAPRCSAGPCCYLAVPAVSGAVFGVSGGIFYAGVTAGDSAHDSHPFFLPGALQWSAADGCFSPS